MGTFGALRPIRFRAAALVLALGLAGCADGAGRPAQVPLELPAGAVRRLELKVASGIKGFGPFVGYYFRPETPGDLGSLEFWCFNERGFYSSDAPVNAMLYTGRAVLTELPATGEPGDTPPSGAKGDGRIIPVFFAEARRSWLASRPDPKDRFVHFHSLYDAAGPSPWGFWLDHVAVASFTYDMGGRVGSASPLYHVVKPGPDLQFARIVEFDSGPRAK